MSDDMQIQIISKCPGRYDNQHGEFGCVINPQCAGCQRRTVGYVTGHWYLSEVPVFDGVCPQRLEMA